MSAKLWWTAAAVMAALISFLLGGWAWGIFSCMLAASFLGFLYRKSAERKHVGSGKSLADSVSASIGEHDLFMEGLAHFSAKRYLGHFDVLEFLKFVKDSKINSDSHSAERFDERQKQLLAGFFADRIFVDRYASVEARDRVRKFLSDKIGIHGLASSGYPVDDGDGVLANDEIDPDLRSAKECGNRGEQIIRNELANLSPRFFAKNGVTLASGKVHEFDHLVFADGRIFMLETKAYTLRGDGSAQNSEAAIEILSDGTIETDSRSGSVHSKKNHHDPRGQLSELRQMLESLLGGMNAEVVPVLVLANGAATLTNACNDYPTAVVQAQKVTAFIEKYGRPSLWGKLSGWLRKNRENQSEKASAESLWHALRRHRISPIPRKERKFRMD